MSDRRRRVRLLLTTIAFVAAVWAVTLLFTGGISFWIGALRVSSRNARNPAIGALLLFAIATWLAPPGARRRTIAGDLTRLLQGATAAASALSGPSLRLFTLLSAPRALTAYAALVVVLTLGLAWTRGAFVAGGSDSYGYVSEAHLFATGRLRMDLPLAGAFPHVPIQALAPLGYRHTEDGTNTLVPTYAPGLPLIMALAEWVGGADAVYVVMPLLSALAVWCTFLIGTRLVGPGVGAGAALLVAASPAFVFQTMGAPMSDVCAAGWWALSLVLLLRDGRGSTAGAGVAAGAAILTRPNLLLVAVVLGLYLLWLVARGGTYDRERMIRLVIFSGPVVIGCLAVAGFNAAWYGSPFRSGYPPGLFSASYWRDNISNFPRWLSESQTPLLLVGFGAPAVASWLPRRHSSGLRPALLLLTGVVVAVFGSYLFYMPFEPWWYLRFLLPAFPALAVLTCITLAALVTRLGVIARALCIGAVLFAAAFSGSIIKDLEVYGENRYRIIGEWARDHLPGNAIVFAMQHGGNVKHYAGREIVRYDYVPRGDYEAALDEIIAAGYRPYLIVDEWEIPPLRELHGAGARGALDWPPVALLPLGNVTVWDLGEDREAARASQRVPELIPVPDAIRRRLP